MTDDLIEAEAEWVPSLARWRNACACGHIGPGTRGGGHDGHIREIVAMAPARRCRRRHRAQRGRLRREHDIIAGKFSPGLRDGVRFGARRIAGRECRDGLLRPAGHPRVLDLGRPGRDQEPAGDRGRVHRGKSDGHGQRDRLRLGAVLGQAPDRSRGWRRPRCVRDGRSARPDYQTRDVLLDLTPYIEGESYDLSQLDANAVKDFTTADGTQFGLPRDLNVIALYYNKDMFDAAGVAYPDDTWDWAKLVEVGKQLTKDTNGDGTPDQWGVYTETTDMENAWSSFVWQAGGDILSADGTTSALDYRSGRTGHPVPAGPDLEGEGLA